jgi:serine/threonine protein kinase
MDVAVKTFPYSSSNSIKEFQNEVSILKSVRHPNCIMFLCYTKEPFSIVTEFMNQGTDHCLLQS